MQGRGQPEPKEGLAAELGILVAIMCAGLIGSCCHVQDQSRRPSEFWTLVKPWSKCPDSHPTGKPMKMSLSTANVEGCKQAQTGCASGWESFKGQVSWTCWPEGTCLYLRLGDVHGCLTNISHFDGSARRL